MTYSQHLFTETKCISEMKRFSFFSLPEALDRVGNKTSITFYFSEWWLQQREAMIFSPHCSGWRLCGNHPPERSQNKALLQKQSPFDSCTDFIQSLLCPCSFTIVTCSLSENSLCPPYLWSCPAQFLTKSQLGRPPAADLVKHDFSVNSFWAIQELINERSSLWPSGLMPACETAGTWDPLLQGSHLDKSLLKPQNTKKLQGTKNNCVHA